MNIKENAVPMDQPNPMGTIWFTPVNSYNLIFFSQGISVDIEVC